MFKSIPAFIPVLLVAALCPGCQPPSLSADTLLAAYERQKGASSPIEVGYPFDGALFPPEVPAPHFTWEDPNLQCDVWAIGIQFQDGAADIRRMVREKEWLPEESLWTEIKTRSTNKTAQIQIVGAKAQEPDKVLSAAWITLSTSTDEVGAPLFYREVNLPFLHAVKDPTKIRWRFGSVDSTEPAPIILENLPVCGNCHSFSADGAVMGMDVDYASDKGSYAIENVTPEMKLSPDDIITWSDFDRTSGVPTFGLLSQVSPNGRYVISTVKDRSVFVPRPDMAFSQLFFPIKGILAVYDRQTGEYSPLPGADDPVYVQSNASWSPDGQTIVFARTKAYELKNLSSKGDVLLTAEECAEFLEHGKEFKFDLYRIPFNEGRGGTAEPIPGASNNGKSNYFARFSPDGKWIVFCQANNYMLLQEDSSLYIMPAEGGEPRRMRCNTGRMNSWHSWSPNGKWMVFSSKHFSIYTQLFLTHIDDQGRSTPPVLLDRMTSASRAANIPEFVNAAPDAIASIKENFVGGHSLYRAGEEYMKQADYAGAEEKFAQALQLEPGHIKARHNLGVAIMKQGREKEAEALFLDVLKDAPDEALTLASLGALYVNQSRLEEARAVLERAIALDPRLPDAHYAMGILHRIEKNNKAALACFRQANEIDPRFVDAYLQRGLIAVEEGRTEEARQCFETVIEHRSKHIEARLQLGLLAARQGEIEEAMKQFEAVLEIQPDQPQALQHLGTAMLSLGRLDDAKSRLEQAIAAQETAEAQYYLGMVMARRNDMDATIEHWRRATELDPDDVRPSANLGAALVALARFSEARSPLEQALRIEPANLFALVNLAEVCAQEGHFDEAAQRAQHALDQLESAGNPAMTAQVKARLDAYTAGRTFQSSPPPAQ